MNKKQRVMLSRILAAAALLILFQFLPLTGVVRFLAYLVPYLVIGYDILLKAGKGIRNRQVFDESFLMAVATDVYKRQMPDRPVVARAALHFWEEPPLSGTRGAGTVFFSGCSLGCVFCQNEAISQRDFGREISVERLREIFWALIDACLLYTSRCV